MLVDQKKMRSPLWASVFPSEKLGERTDAMRPQFSEWVLPAWWRSAPCSPDLLSTYYVGRAAVASHLSETSQPLGCPAARTEPQNQLQKPPESAMAQKGGPGPDSRPEMPPAPTLNPDDLPGELGTTSPKGSLNPGAPVRGTGVTG